LPSQQITAIVKTFNRSSELTQLVKSIQRVQPDIAVIIADDSDSPSYFPGITTLDLPYNSGISIGRNMALDAVETPYILLLDDDFVFYRKTQIAQALHVMQQTPEIDIMGGKVIDLPQYRANYYHTTAFPWSVNAVRKCKDNTLAGLPVYDKVANFFIGRTESLRKVGWDPELKVFEHADFFTRAKGKLTTVYNGQFAILHTKNRFDRSQPDRIVNALHANHRLRQLYFKSPEKNSCTDVKSL
jgi:glycosyltransferase involved in cell wall biosynthesis